jgi:hypothetical protein
MPPSAVESSTASMSSEPAVVVQLATLQVQEKLVSQSK